MNVERGHSIDAAKTPTQQRTPQRAAECAEREVCLDLISEPGAPPENGRSAGHVFAISNPNGLAFHAKGLENWTGDGWLPGPEARGFAFYTAGTTRGVLTFDQAPHGRLRLRVETFRPTRGWRLCGFAFGNDWSTVIKILAVDAQAASC